MPNLAKSAKPPSPVQIRAAPPFLPQGSRVPAGARLAGHRYCSESPQVAPRFRHAASAKSVRCDELSASDLCRGGGFETSASVSRPRRKRSIGRSAAGADRADARARSTIEPRTRPGVVVPIAAATLPVRRPVGFAGATTQASWAGAANHVLFDKPRDVSEAIISVWVRSLRRNSTIQLCTAARGRRRQKQAAAMRPHLTRQER